MNIPTRHYEVWIALAKVKSITFDDKLGTSGCAYVNVVGLAKNRLSFRNTVAEELSKMNFKLLIFEDAEKLEERVKKFKVDDRILELTKGLSNEAQVKFSSFHTYD
jgi:predicted nuclease of restriction endonuclease-like RecB superfamily